MNDVILNNTALLAEEKERINALPSDVNEMTPEQQGELFKGYRVLVEVLEEEGLSRLEALQVAINHHKTTSVPVQGIRLSYPLDLIIEATNGEWDGYSDKRKASYLSELGFDTRKYNYRIDNLLYLDKNKIKYGPVVYGAERIDSGWVNTIVNGKRVASDEARDRHKYGGYN